MVWKDMCHEQFESAIQESGSVCVLPIGCMEMHGEHLPVGTDCYEAEYIAREAADIEPVCIFPTFWFGDVQGLQHLKGAVVLSVELQQQMLKEMCAEIARNGFKKILILNGHGENTFLLANFVRSTQHSKKDYVVLKRNCYSYGIHDLADDLEKGESFPELTSADIANVKAFTKGRYAYGHACIEETSMMLSIAPQTVRMDKVNAVSGSSTEDSHYLAEYGMTDTTRFWLQDHPNSYNGEKVEWSSAGIGKALLRKNVEQQAEACRRLKQDDRILEWNAAWNEKW